MTPEQIIEMAKQAGFTQRLATPNEWWMLTNEIQDFAQLVRNTVLEEAAQLCGSKAPAIGNTNYGTACNECAGAIRSLKS